MIGTRRNALMESLLCENPNKGRSPYVGAGDTDNCVKNPCPRPDTPTETIGDEARAFTPLELDDCPSPDTDLGTTAAVLLSIGAIGLIVDALWDQTGNDCDNTDPCADGGDTDP